MCTMGLHLEANAVRINVGLHLSTSLCSTHKMNNMCGNHFNNRDTHGLYTLSQKTRPGVHNMLLSVMLSKEIYVAVAGPSLINP